MSKRYFSIVYTSRKLLQIARDAARRAVDEPDQALVAILFAAAAVEGFFNELLEIADQAVEAGAEPPVVTMSVLLHEAEDQKAQVSLKFQLIHVALRQKPLRRGGRLYQDFDLLFKLRNSLVHMRPDRASWDFATYERTAKPFVYTDRLVARGLVQRERVGAAFDWVELVSTPDVAQWAYETALVVARYTCELLPKGAFAAMALQIWGFGSLSFHSPSE